VAAGGDDLATADLLSDRRIDRRQVRVLRDHAVAVVDADG
jgi:hypothetical protein